MLQKNHSLRQKIVRRLLSYTLQSHGKFWKFREFLGHFAKSMKNLCNTVTRFTFPRKPAPPLRYNVTLYIQIFCNMPHFL
jgi:N-glycosylase/DNA lyase